MVVQYSNGIQILDLSMIRQILTIWIPEKFGIQIYTEILIPIYFQFGSETVNVTFVGPNDTSYEVSLLEPTGICVDNHGNIFVGDKEGYNVLKFAPNGLLLQTIKMICQPLGIKYVDGVLYVADYLTKKVLGYKI